MGSTTFYDEFFGEPNATAKEAYHQLVQDATWESGHEGYNGTISTTSGVQAVNVAPMTKEAAYALAETRIEKLSKWENAEAIPLVAETPDVWEQLPNQRVTLSVSGDVLNDEARFHAALAKALKVKPDQIQGWSNVNPNDFKRTTSVEAGVKAEVPKEKAVTRYFIITGNYANPSLPAWETGYETQAKARAALPTVLRYGFNGVPDVKADIIGITRRESGAPLVSATVGAKKITGDFIVKTRKLVKKGTAGTERVGWLFYGWAAM